jgi:hypothetical protein
MARAFSDICQREMRRQQEERGASETKKTFNDTKCEILQKGQSYHFCAETPTQLIFPFFFYTLPLQQDMEDTCSKSYSIFQITTFNSTKTY